MICAWKELLSILPSWLSQELDKCCHETLQELRLRLDMPPQLIHKDTSQWLDRPVSSNDLNFCINTASRYSPWAVQSVAQGYITAPGGHRIGLCGDTVMHNGQMSGIRSPRSLCIRVARDFRGIAHPYRRYKGSILIIGPPGSGKTTFLRDLIRQISEFETVAVVDERCELFPDQFFTGNQSLDILSSCPKKDGIDMLIRTMGPVTIAVDEITSSEDCAALLRAGWCGVRLLATAHAANSSDLHSRSIYKPLVNTHLFEHILILNRDKTVHAERIFS